MVECVKVPAPLFCQLAKVLVRDVAFGTSVKILEYGVDFVHLILYSHMIESLLKLRKTDPIVEVEIEVAIGFGKVAILLRELHIEHVQHSLQDTTLCLEVVNYWLASCVGRHDVEHVGTVVVRSLFHHW